MSDYEAPHILVLTIDPDRVDQARRGEYEIDPKDPELYDWKIECPHDLNDFARPCAVSYPCDKCTVTDKEVEDGEGECSESADGWHTIHESDPMHRVPECWAQVCDDAADVVHDFILDKSLTVGRYPVMVTCEESSVELELVEVAV